MADTSYSSCIDLAYKMNTDAETYSSFKTAMMSGGDTFVSWLNDNGVPEDLAKKISTQSGNELALTLGDVVCDRFW